MFKVALALIGMSLSTLGHCADQFNLVCEGVVKEGPFMKQAPMKRVYHIDLKANRWCTDTEYLNKIYKCDMGYPIAEVTDDEITLIKSGPNKPAKFAFITRSDGSYVNVVRQIFWFENGNCKLAEFTPLPMPAF